MPALEIDGEQFDLADDQNPTVIIARAHAVMDGRAGPAGLTGIRLASGVWQGMNWRAVTTVVEAAQPEAGA